MAVNLGAHLPEHPVADFGKSNGSPVTRQCSQSGQSDCDRGHNGQQSDGFENVEERHSVTVRAVHLVNDAIEDHFQRPRFEQAETDLEQQRGAGPCN